MIPSNTRNIITLLAARHTELYVCTSGRRIRLMSSSKPDKQGDLIPEEIYLKRGLPAPPVALVPPEPVKQELINRIPVEYHGVTSANFNDQSIWLPIYRFPYIGALKIVIKFKVYLTGFTTAIVLNRLYNSISGLSFSTTPTTVALSAISLTGLLFIGNAFRKLVCQIYVSPDMNFVRMCRFSFFGRRIDMVLPREQVVPLTETNISTVRNLFCILEFTHPQKIDLNHDTIEFYDQYFYLPLRFGRILDRDRFEETMGKFLKRKMGS